MDCSTPGFLVNHQLPELTQTHVHWVSDAIQLSGECMLLGSLSCHSKDLEWRTLKPLGGSQLLEDRPCYNSWINHCYSSVLQLYLFRWLQENPSLRREGTSIQRREEKSAPSRGREREWKKRALAPLFISFFCSPNTTISSSVVPFSSCLQSFPASGSFPVSQFFTSGGHNIGVSVFPMNIQDWFPLGWTGWMSLQSKGLSRVFSNTTIQKHQFFGVQLSLHSLTFFTLFFMFFTFFTFTSLTFLYILYNSTLCRSLMFYWTWLCPGCVCIFVQCNFILLFKSGWGIHYLYQTEESGHLFSFAVSTVN